MLKRAAERLLQVADRYALRIFMIALVAAALCYSLYDLVFEPYYPIADWLINYSHGFVRRGFIGEFILLASRLMHVPPPWMVVNVQMAIYIPLLWGVYKLAAPLRRGLLWYWMIFSPAALAFMILNPMNSVRKETLAPAALTATIFLLRRGYRGATLSLIIAALFATMVLSHESPFCCLPFFFAAVAVYTKDLKYAARVTVVPFALAGVLLVVLWLHPGNEAIAIGVCKSVGGRWTGVDDTRDLCSGAIGHLAWTLARSRTEQRYNLHYWHMYLPRAVLAIMPYVAALITLYRRDRLRFEAGVIGWTALVSALASAPLFYVSVDWGRWIQMQIACLLVLILFAAQTAKGFQPGYKPQPLTHGGWWRIPAGIAVFLYCTCWTLPVLGLQPMRHGYRDVPKYIRAQVNVMRQIDGYHTIDRGW